MKRLILSEIPKDFIPEVDIVAGPFCFLGHEDFPGWETQFFDQDPFQTVEQIEKAADESNHYANSILSEFAEYLNCRNKSNYSIQFWRILIFPWLLIFLQTLWERYYRIDNLLQKYAKESLSVKIVQGRKKWDFFDTQDFLNNGALNIHYNEWLFSRFIEDRCPEKWTLEFVERDPVRQYIPQEPDWGKKLWKKISIHMRCKGVYGINPIISFFFSLLLSCKPPLKQKLSSNLNNTTGKPCFTYESHDDLRKTIKEYALQTIPKCYFQVEKLLSNNSKITPGKIRLIGPLLYHDEAYKYFLGHCVEAGEKIVPTQHGCAYGTAKKHPSVAEVEYKQHAFFTWGWKQQGNYELNARPLSSPYLSHHEKGHQCKNNRLIVVGTFARLLPRSLFIYPQPIEQIACRRNKVVFFKQLTPTVFKKSSYRPYPKAYGALEDEPFMKKYFPELEIVKGKLESQILQCRLLVLDNPGTTLNLAMAANIPTVCFWEKEQWAMCEQAEPYFEALEKVGVFFNTPEDAAAKVNDIWDDVTGWWAQPDIQTSRQNWCSQYARTNRFWWWEWAKEIWKI